MNTWRIAFSRAYAYFDGRTSPYWAQQLAVDYAEFIRWGKQSTRGAMIFGTRYPYQAFT